MARITGHLFVLFVAINLLCSMPLFAEEGMYPLSELKRLDLASKGMKISADAIFNTDGVSLVDGICRVNGCTGSFVSKDGLIITNHHCAFDAIQKASTTSSDLLANGFIAGSREKEIPAPGYTVRITESYRDVSDEVLSVVTDSMSFLERTKAIERRRKELELAAEKISDGLRAEVAEMFIGKTYVLFLYTYLKDVRLVFAPPISIGAFGGELDNWEWPRHTGDFSFMRAYVAPNGKAAEYAMVNVPYHPKRPIQIESNGVDEGDLVFLLGYPGRTVRHRTASFVRYEESVRLPRIAELYAWQIHEMEQAGADDRNVAIKHATRIKLLANVEKRSRGQVLGAKRAKIANQRFELEMELQSFIDRDPDRKAKYGRVLPEIAQVYDEMSQRGPLEINLKELKTACRALAIAYTIYESAVERSKPDVERESPYMDRNFALTTQQLKLDVGDWDGPTDRIMLAGMLKRLKAIDGVIDLEPLQAWLDDDRQFDQRAVSAIQQTKLGDIKFVSECLGKSQADLEKNNDPILKFIIALYPTYVKLRDVEKERDGKLNQLYGYLMEVKQQHQSTNFIPDANGTLRLTMGHVKSYSPSDAIVKTPISTVDGLLEKSTGIEPYISPKQVIEAIEAKRFGPFVHPRLNTVPVAILYSTDTTGGNSGSPVLNAKGNLVGVNFDRTFEATINDFAWDDRYSRSIGVDIRYVLWLVGEVFAAKDLLNELQP